MNTDSAFHGGSRFDEAGEIGAITPEQKQRENGNE
jgi:hypothetical protein